MRHQLPEIRREACSGNAYCTTILLLLLRASNDQGFWTARRAVYDLLDDAEEVDVGVVDGEVDEDDARASIHPQVVLHLVDDRQRARLGRTKVLHEAATSVRRDEAPVVDTVQLLSSLIHPTAQKTSP